jgi:hypothetical protein
MNEEDKLIPVSEAAEIMQCKPRTVSSKCRDGILRCVRTVPMTGKFKTTRKWIGEYMKKCEVKK